MKKYTLLLAGFMLVAGTFAAGPLSAAPKSSSTIVETALAVNADTGEFSTLIAAVTAAGLVDTLNGKRQFTVFAPTDAAFAELGLNAGNIGSLPVDTLTNILLYHVANGNRLSQSVINADQIRMVNKGFVMVDGTMINNASIIAADVIASNGVIHVIDKVLLP